MPRLPPDQTISRSVSPESEVEDIPASIPPTQTKDEDGSPERQLEEELTKAVELDKKNAKKGKGSRKQTTAAKKEPVNGNAEDDDEEQEEEYEVESIVDHMFKGKKCLYRVRWRGWSEADDTWEPESNLLPEAAVALAEYQEQTGGAPQPTKNVRKAVSKPDLKEEADGDASPPAKRAKRTHRSNAGAMEPDSKEWKSQELGAWLPSDKSNWEDLVHEVETVERDNNGNLYAYIRFRNGKRSRVANNLYHSRCPRALLRFYENHLNFQIVDTSGMVYGEDEPEVDID